ncbi:hypothetical protein [Enemella evansiae]|uniref:hypothetical protein n=1 Tax=Enemella evansiae TaxID=2016499 RepID=UPI0011405F57|nr:hypothetical protein [Enemella evansiae]
MAKKRDGLPGLRLGRPKTEPKKRGRRKPWHARTPHERGWGLRGTGETTVVQPALESRGTTVQVCGLWPFSAGATMPTIGTPLGSHQRIEATVYGDPMSWFVGGVIATPSGFILGRPAVGKSSLSRRICTWMDYCGVIPMILADLKPDYRAFITACGGETIPVGEVTTDVDGVTTVGHINPLDLLGAHGRIAHLPPRVRGWALEKLLSQQNNVLRGLLEIANQGEPLTGEEASLIPTVLNLLQVGPERTPLDRDAPTIREVLAVFEQDQPHPRLMMKVLAASPVEYHASTRRLRQLLMALLEDGPFGAVFDGPTRHLDLSKPGGFDVSQIDDEDQAKQAAVQLACWSYGVASIALQTKLSDVYPKEYPRRRYLLIMDELWRLLRVSGQLVYRVDKLTRINREMGVGQLMITHTMDDLRLSTEELTRIAWGFVERASMVFLGGLAGREFGNLQEVFALSRQERESMTDWAAEGGIDPATGKGTGPRGRGKFLMKLGKQPGVPFEVVLTKEELVVHDTNRRWAELTAQGEESVA